MRCDHDGHADLMEGDEDVQDARRRLGVQIGGGLVGNEEPGRLTTARAMATRCCSPPES